MSPDNLVSQAHGESLPRSDGGFFAWVARRLLAAAFDLLYHQLAFSYDLISWVVSGGRWREWRRAALADLPSGRILEIGPGTGHLLLELLESGRDAYGVDSSPEMLRIACKRLASHGFEGRLVSGDARRLPFADSSFDGLALTFPAPFIGARFWDEAARVLRPGGKVVVVLSAASRQWPWPGVLEWVLAGLAGQPDHSEGTEVLLAPWLDGRLVDRMVGRGLVTMVIAERRRQ